jgi:hypothetical protein
LNALRVTLPIDHLGVAGRDVQGLIQLYSDLGFRITPKQELMATDDSGAVVSLGQQSAHVMFGDSYLELTAVPGALEGHHLGAYLSRFSGLHILALAAGDAEAVHRRLESEGLELGPLQLAQREVNYGSGGTARFCWFQAMASQLPSALICLVEHQTPELVFQDEMTTHPNGVLGISRVGYYTQNPGELADKLKALETTSGTEVEIIDELTMPGDRLQSKEFMAEIDFSVCCLVSFKRLLQRNGVSFNVNDDVLVISSRLTGGVSLQFREA